MSRHRNNSRFAFVALLCVVAFMSTVAVVQAGPVTNPTPPGSAPFTRLGVYQQVFDIVDISGNYLRLGNRGGDVSGSSDIIFRPSTSGSSGSIVTAGNGVFTHAASYLSTYADLYIPGDLCLGSTPVCKHQLIAGAAASLWQSGTDTSSGAPVRYLEPMKTGSTPQTPGVQIGSSGSPVGTQAISIGNNVVMGTIGALNKGSGLAADFTGTVQFGDVSMPWSGVTAYGAITIDGYQAGSKYEPWSGDQIQDPVTGAYRTNQGEGSGLDADLANGNQVTIEPASSCTTSDGSHPRVACLCFKMKYAKQFTNASTSYDTVYAGPVKHCIDLANRY